MEIVHRITRVDRVIPSTTRMWREQAVTSEKGRLSLSLCGRRPSYFPLFLIANGPLLSLRPVDNQQPNPTTAEAESKDGKRKDDGRMERDRFRGVSGHQEDVLLARSRAGKLHGVQS